MTNRADFARVKNTGHAKAGRFVILSTLPDPGLENIRTGFITSKRSARRAHDRVLMRRRFRALVQKHAPHFADIRRFLVVIARPAASQATFQEIEEDWVRQARRLGLFPKPESSTQP